MKKRTDGTSEGLAEKALGEDASSHRFDWLVKSMSRSHNHVTFIYALYMLVMCYRFYMHVMCRFIIYVIY